jgi:hypothetical protein
MRWEELNEKRKKSEENKAWNRQRTKSLKSQR